MSSINFDILHRNYSRAEQAVKLAQTGSELAQSIFALEKAMRDISQAMGDAAASVRCFWLNELEEPVYETVAEDKKPWQHFQGRWGS